MTRFYLSDLIFSLSYALDYVEREFAGVAPRHSKRVACTALKMGRGAGLGGDALLGLGISAALHDNGLPEYQQLARAEAAMTLSDEGMRLHCQYGERNVSGLPFYAAVKGGILYHHERADGRGAFGMALADTPKNARRVHLADAMDAAFDLRSVDAEKYARVCAAVRAGTGTLYDADTAAEFLAACPTPEAMQQPDATLDAALHALLPEVPVEYTPAQLMTLASIFAKIIDDKSSFTCRHSLGIAEKARRMARWYGWDEDIAAQLYLAGAVHDLGKLMVQSDILEKPGRLTAEEYQHIQNHAEGSFLALRGIRGLEQVTAWAYLHHEKLDGSGYPFGYKAEQLDFRARLMACLDIYQALVEARPYKAGMEHSRAVGILNELAGRGQLDSGIVADIDRCFGENAAPRKE